MDKAGDFLFGEDDKPPIPPPEPPPQVRLHRRPRRKDGQ